MEINLQTKIAALLDFFITFTPEIPKNF